MIFLYSICIVFIVSGALNLGITGFWSATPFMLLALVTSIKSKYGYMFTLVTFGICIFAILFNLTIEKNPLVFPILIGGSVEILRDGYYVTHSDGSGGFWDTEDVGRFENGDHPQKVTLRKLMQGEQYQVTGVHVGSTGFSSDIQVETEVGNFSEDDLSEFERPHELGGAPVFTNKKVVRFGKHSGLLMVWPLFIILPLMGSINSFV